MSALAAIFAPDLPQDLTEYRIELLGTAVVGAAVGIAGILLKDWAVENCDTNRSIEPEIPNDGRE